MEMSPPILPETDRSAAARRGVDTPGGAHKPARPSSRCGWWRIHEAAANRMRRRALPHGSARDPAARPAVVGPDQVFFDFVRGGRFIVLGGAPFDGRATSVHRRLRVVVSGVHGAQPMRAALVRRLQRERATFTFELRPLLNAPHGHNLRPSTQRTRARHEPTCASLFVSSFHPPP